MKSEYYSLLRDLLYAASIALAGTTLSLGMIYSESIGEWVRLWAWRLFG